MSVYSNYLTKASQLLAGNHRVLPLGFLTTHWLHELWQSLLALLVPQGRVLAQCVLRWLELLAEVAWLTSVRTHRSQIVILIQLVRIARLQSSLLRSHELGSGRSLLLLDPLVVLNLAVAPLVACLLVVSNGDCT